MGRLNPALLAFVAAQIIVMTQVDALYAQSCTLNHQKVEFSGKLCIRGNCSIIHQKLRFMGDKILLYPDASSDQGTIFQLGRSIEMKNADSAWRASGPPGSIEHSTTLAEHQGRTLFLTIDHQWSQSGKLIGHGWRKMGFEFPDCASCQVIHYEFSFDRSDQPGFRSTFDRYFCRMSN